MNYPITLTFKLLALASQIYIRDAGGNTVGYVKQKLLKLKEDINVFADENQTRLLFNIKADRVIDFSAQYNFTDHQGVYLGSIKRHGMRSLWKTHYLISNAQNQQIMEINEENAWVKVVDALIGEIPVVGKFTGYVFNPANIVSKNDQTPVARLQKQPAMFEGKFLVSTEAQMSAADENLVLLGILTMTLLERARG